MNLVGRILRRIVGRPPLAPIPAPSPSENVDYNRHLWDNYARRWGRRRVHPEEPGARSAAGREQDPAVIGDEWGTREAVDGIVAEYILPYVNPRSVVAEIGSGGGRISTRVAPLVGHLCCFDISSEMLSRARTALSGQSNVAFVLLPHAGLPPEYRDTFDFIYAFDVFVHLDLHTIWKYLNDIRRALKEDGAAFLHTANLKAPEGWKRFASQERYTVEGHYFVVPELIQFLVERAGLCLLKQSTVDVANFYLARDYLCIVGKRASTEARVAGVQRSTRDDPPGLQLRPTVYDPVSCPGPSSLPPGVTPAGA